MRKKKVKKQKKCITFEANLCLFCPSSLGRSARSAMISDSNSWSFFFFFLLRIAAMCWFRSQPTKYLYHSKLFCVWIYFSSNFFLSQNSPIFSEWISVEKEKEKRQTLDTKIVKHIFHSLKKEIYIFFVTLFLLFTRFFISSLIAKSDWMRCYIHSSFFFKNI